MDPSATKEGAVAQGLRAIAQSAAAEILEAETLEGSDSGSSSADGRQQLRWRV